MSVLVGRVEAVCTANCRYDADGTCVRCKALDPDRWIVIRIPSEQEKKSEQLLADVRQSLADLGLDPERAFIGQPRRAASPDSGTAE